METLFRVAMALAAAHLVVGMGVSVFGNPEGELGGILYVLLYAVPLVAIAWALRSGRRRWQVSAGWVAFVLGVFYSLIVVGNWSGYSNPQAIFVVAITAPTVALDLAIFWATLHLSRSAGKAGA